MAWDVEIRRLEADAGWRKVCLALVLFAEGRGRGSGFTRIRKIEGLEEVWS